MIHNHHIPFNNEEKDQFLNQEKTLTGERQGVGRILSKIQRSQPFDQQQDALISRKSTVFNAQAAKNVQAFSQFSLSRIHKIIPSKKEQPQEKYSFNQQLSNSKNHHFGQIVSNTSAFYAPKSLSKIERNSKDLNRSQLDLIKNNETSLFEQESRSMSKGRSFSINQYDIYKPGFLANRQDLSTNRRVSAFLPEEKPFQKNSSFAESQEHHQLTQQKPHPPLKISFENQLENELPEVKEVLQDYSPNQTKKLVQQEAIQILLPRKHTKQEPSKVNVVQLEAKKRKDSHTSSTKNGKNADSRHDKSTPEALSMKKRHSHYLQSQAKNQRDSFSIKKVKAKINQTQYGIQLDPDQLVLENFTKKKNNQSHNQERQQATNKVQSKQRNLEDSHSNSQKVDILIIEKDQKEVDPQKLSLKVEQQFEEKQTKSSRMKASAVLQSYRPFQMYRFGIANYMQVYQILKGIQHALKNAIFDSPNLLKNIKKYLQIIAGGSLDHIQGYSMPLHRLKILKNALLYERIGVVIISFAYAAGKMNQCKKFIINLISYSTSNTLLILKILQGSDLEQNSEKNPIMAKSDRLVQKRNFDTVRNSNDIILDSIFKIAKTQEAFFESFKQIVKAVGKSSLEQTFYNVLEYFAFFLCISGLHSSIPFLSVAPNPYLQQTVDQRPTLVIDIIQLFCHGTRKSKSHIFRPHTQYFLAQMAQYYEIISFTCAYPTQIDKIIDLLDPKRYIKHRLYRHHAMMVLFQTIQRQGVLFKDAERLGRNTNRILILDSQQNILPGQSKNSIAIPVWRGNKSDTTLAQLCPILATIAVKQMNCLEAAQKINQQHLKNESQGIKYLNFGINLN